MLNTPKEYAKITRLGVDERIAFMYIEGMRYEQSLSLSQIILFTGLRNDTHLQLYLLLVELALAEPIRLLIGGNRYDHYGINYALAAETPHYEQILDSHIRISRAETCYQMVELLCQTRATAKPILILDLFKSFYDTAVPERAIQQLLNDAIEEIRRLSGRAAVVMNAQPEQERPYLLKRLERIATHVVRPSAQPQKVNLQRELLN